MLNIIVPMAGRGSRFSKEGYKLPKPLIKVGHNEMVKVVIDNIAPTDKQHRFIFICLEEHIYKYGLGEKLREWSPGCEIVTINRVTEGAACTVLLASEFFNNKNPMMIANCDQFIDTNIDDFITIVEKDELDGLIMTMDADDPKWSFVKLNEEGLVTELKEKEVISNHATVGIYYFSEGSEFVSGANQMIANNERVNGEFYVAPVYNELIKKGKRIGTFSIGSDFNGMYGLGTPKDLEKFLASKLELLKT